MFGKRVDMGGYIVLGIVLGILLLGGIVFLYIRSKVRRLSRQVYGTDNILDGIKQQEIEFREQPKTVMGVTSILLPQIHKDFPEFHWPEWKARCEEHIRAYLQCLETNAVSDLPAGSEDLKETIRREIEDRQGQGLQERFDSIVTHQTEITDYTKKNGQCLIRTLTSVEFIHTREGNHPIKGMKEQHRYVTELYYIQDLDAVQTTEKGLGIVCPNCGAPVNELGAKKCTYCGCAIVELNLRVWKIGKIYMRD